MSSDFMTRSGKGWECQWHLRFYFTPKGLHLPARGCDEERGATPGACQCPQTPTGFRPSAPRPHGTRRNPLGVWNLNRLLPRVGEAPTLGWQMQPLRGKAEGAKGFATAPCDGSGSLKLYTSKKPEACRPPVFSCRDLGDQPASSARSLGLRLSNLAMLASLPSGMST